MKRALILALISLFATFALAQDRPVPAAPLHSVYVGADGKFEADPDTAVITFSIQPQDSTARGAYDKAARAAEQVRQILRANNIDPKAAEMGSFSVQPMYDWKSGKQKLIGYRVAGHITVKLRQKDWEKLGPLTQQLAEIETASGQGLGYELQEMEAAKKKAVEDAFVKARNSATAVAGAGGRALGELIYASVDVSEPVHILPMQSRGAMKSMAAEATPAPTEGFSAQRITITARVNALFGMK